MVAPAVGTETDINAVTRILLEFDNAYLTADKLATCTGLSQTRIRQAVKNMGNWLEWRLVKPTTRGGSSLRRVYAWRFREPTVKGLCTP